MKLFPANASQQLEFEKIKILIAEKCRMQYAKEKAEQLRIHTHVDFIEHDLLQTQEYKTILQSGLVFPNDFSAHISRELKLLSIPGATLAETQFVMIRKLSQNIAQIFKWFGADAQMAYPRLHEIISDNYYEKVITELIDKALDDNGTVKDSASVALADVRISLHRKRFEQRKIFDRLASKLTKLGYLSDITESFMNGRRVLAVNAEQKRMVKGVMHNESDSRRTSYIEPEETTGINNEIFSLENEEIKEVQRILKALTAALSIYSALLFSYFKIVGEFDFIRGKANFAINIGGVMPVISAKPCLTLIDAYHPLLLLYNEKLGKKTIPLSLTLTEKEHIIVISGPNAGGKTVTLKTVGLLQLMLQSGLLVPVSPDSTMGIFKQLMIHIGDEQSLEFELSTYSSHLKNMKYFLENANGKTLFFVDELGSGSDPNLGGAFAEVIMEELAFKHAFGIVTTHYLNLKVMAGKVRGIVNAAMQFDEKNLLPLYKIQIGKPGSSYTFSIAERIGLDKKLIQKAKVLSNDGQFTLDKLLNKTEQDMQIIESDKKKLNTLIIENLRLKTDMQKVIAKEAHLQEMEIEKEKNQINAEQITNLKDMERRLKAMIQEWKKAEDKSKVVKLIDALFQNQKSGATQKKKLTKAEKKFIEIKGEIEVGNQVKMIKNRQVGTVTEIRGKNAVLKVGTMPMTVALEDLVKIEEKEQG